MTVGFGCAFRLDLTAPPNRCSRGLASEGSLFHPFRQFPSDGQDQESPGDAVNDPRLILEQAGLTPGPVVPSAFARGGLAP